jgi:hypothetical protein
MLFLRTESFQVQAARWPAAGHHILARYDDETVVVAVAWRPAILSPFHRRGQVTSVADSLWIA